MPLTLAQKARVRMYLGYARAMGGGDPLERAFPGLTEEVEELVTETLASLATVETQLSNARTQAQFSRVEDVYFADSAGLRGLRAEGQRLCHRLASLIGVQVANDVFSAGNSGGITLRG